MFFLFELWDKFEETGADDVDFRSNGAAGIAVLNLFFTERKLGLFLVFDRKEF